MDSYNNLFRSSISDNSYNKLKDTVDRKDWGAWACHDPAVYYDDATDMFYIYSTDTSPDRKHIAGGQIRTSKDLVTFRYEGTALKDVPKDVKKITGAHGLWAPDIIKVGEEYRLYYSASTFGSMNSLIGLAVSNSAAGPFTHKAIVVRTTEESPVNAIDANIIKAHDSDRTYLVYGSFWGGIRMLELSNETGLPLEEGYGHSIACRPRKDVDTAIEGPYIRYNSQTGYYYLFVSYDSLTDYYNVRVGRSKDIMGPYVDYNGVPMTDMTDPYNTGLKITTGYSFKEGTGYMALGHNSVIEHNNSWYLVCHARYEACHYAHSLNVRKMFFTKDGWPVVSPCIYQGEDTVSPDISHIPASYMRIDFNNKPTSMFEYPAPLTLMADRTFSLRDRQGTYTYEDGLLTLRYSDSSIVESLYAFIAWDSEESRPCIALSGINNTGKCIWCKSV